MGSILLVASFIVSGLISSFGVFCTTASYLLDRRFQLPYAVLGILFFLLSTPRFFTGTFLGPWLVSMVHWVYILALFVIFYLFTISLSLSRSYRYLVLMGVGLVGAWLSWDTSFWWLYPVGLGVYVTVFFVLYGKRQSFHFGGVLAQLRSLRNTALILALMGSGTLFIAGNSGLDLEIWRVFEWMGPVFLGVNGVVFLRYFADCRYQYLRKTLKLFLTFFGVFGVLVVGYALLLMIRLNFGSSLFLEVLLLSTLIYVVFSYLQTGVSSLLDRIFRYDIEIDESFTDITQYFKDDLYLQQITDKTVHYISQLLGVSNVHLFSYGGAILDELKHEDFDQFFSADPEILQQFFVDYDRPLDLTQVYLDMKADSNAYVLYRSWFETFSAFGVELIFPIKMSEASTIYLILSKKDDGTSFSVSEKALLISICTFLSAVLQNAIYYQKLMFNKDLMDLIKDFSIQLNETVNRSDLFVTWASYFNRLFGGALDVIYQFNPHQEKWDLVHCVEELGGIEGHSYACPIRFDPTTRYHSNYQFYRPDVEGIDHDIFKAILAERGRNTALFFYLCDEKGAYMMLVCTFDSPLRSFPVSQYLIVDMYLQLLHVSFQNSDQYLNLKEEQVYNESILEQLSTPVILVNSDRVITGLNRAAEDMLQNDVWQWVDRPVEQLSEFSAEFTKILEALDRTHSRNIELNLAVGEYEKVYSVSEMSLSEDYGGHVLVFTDVSDKRLLEEQVSHASRLSALGTLAAGVAHEIKNPLVAIRTFTQLLPKKYQDEGFKERYMSIVPPQIERISALCDSLVSLGAPKTPERENVLFSELLDRVFSIGELHGDESQRLFSIDCPEGFFLDVDPEQFEQVLLNLILNAVESLEGIENGRIQIQGLEASSVKMVKVRDNGCGIEPDRVTHLFDPFFTTKITGTGLGMSIVHQIVTAHGGDIHVSSDVGVGTTFTIELPQG